MSSSKKFLKTGIIEALAACFIAFVLLSILLFWARSFCESLRRDVISFNLEARPSGLVPPEIENDPNAAIHSYFSVYRDLLSRNNSPFDISFGFNNYFIERQPGGRCSNIFVDSDNLQLSFDKKKGLFVFEYDKKPMLVKNNQGEITSMTKYIRGNMNKIFAGPEGFSLTPDKSIGRFYEPLRPVSTFSGPQQFIAFDKKLRKFFNLDLKNNKVTKGPEIRDDSKYNPLWINYTYRLGLLNIIWQPPLMEIKNVDPNNKEELEELRNWKQQDKYYKPLIKISNFLSLSGNYLVVFNSSGRIDMLDRNTLEITGTAGWMPPPSVFFEPKFLANARDILDYDIQPLFLGNPGQYRGMCVAALSRDGTSFGAFVFDSNGKTVSLATPTIDSWRYDSSTRKVSSALNVPKFILESMQPPVLGAASYVTADSIDAVSSLRTIFLLPNSFVAMKARRMDLLPHEKILQACLLLLPSLLLSLCLAVSVNNNAANIGMSKPAQRWWSIAVFFFGLPVFLGYWMTRPDIKMVTCPSCGQGRRPDMDCCHRCGSKWVVPELVPPAWRVAD